MANYEKRLVFASFEPQVAVGTLRSFCIYPIMTPRVEYSSIRKSWVFQRIECVCPGRYSYPGLMSSTEQFMQIFRYIIISHNYSSLELEFIVYITQAFNVARS